MTLSPTIVYFASFIPPSSTDQPLLISSAYHSPLLTHPNSFTAFISGS